MADEFQEITTTSWGKRIVDSLMGIIFGIILFIASFLLIFWNEGRSVDRIRTLDEGRNLVVAVTSEPRIPANNGALIHLSGRATTAEILKDPLFGVQENALKLRRTVEMYQWKEATQTKIEKNLGGSETSATTYSYDKTWSENRIDSASFKHREGHENPPSPPYASEIYKAGNITIGAFKLTNPFIEQITEFVSYPLSEQNVNAMDRRLKKSFILSGNEYFKGDPANPQIGAIRIHFGIIKPTELSIVGKQDNDSIQTYNTKNGSIHLLEMGSVDAVSMFSSAESENTLIAWLIRLGAFLLMWIGLAMVFSPIKVLGDVVPFLGSILGAGIGFVAGVVSLVLSFITIALAWIVFRPVIGLALLALAGGFFFGGFNLIKKKLQKSD